MGVLANTVQADILNKYQGVASKQVIHAVSTASQKTGVDFAYLMEQAAAESSFNPKAAAKTSSARGLYQFIDNTWLGMVAQKGHKYGLGHLADKIDMQNGKPQVQDAATRQRILDLRNDPKLAAFMAAEFSADNKAHLEQNVKGRDIGATDLYMAHFMGAGGAAKFLNSLSYNPEASGASLFPTAAAANKNVFYNKDGSPRTLQQIYNFFDNKFSDTNSPSNGTVSPSPETTVATTTPRATTAATAAHPSAAIPPSFDPAVVAGAFSSVGASDSGVTFSGYHRPVGAGLPTQTLSPVSILLMAEITGGLADLKKSYN